MSKQNCEVFAYIEDFIIVSGENDARHHFDKLSSLFVELRLPMNEDKLGSLLVWESQLT